MFIAFYNLSLLFHRFSLLFITFHYFFITLHCLSLLFIAFHNFFRPTARTRGKAHRHRHCPLETPAIKFSSLHTHTQLCIATHRSATEPNPISRLAGVSQSTSPPTSDIYIYIYIYTYVYIYIYIYTYKHPVNPNPAVTCI